MTSGCYVYAILARETRLPIELVGFGGAPLSIVPWRSLAAVTSQLEMIELSPTPERILRHEAVVEGLRVAGPALPVRFGTVFAGPSAAAQAIADRYDVLAGDLARVGDKVELGVTVLWDPDEDAIPAQTRSTPGHGDVETKNGEASSAPHLPLGTRGAGWGVRRTLRCPPQVDSESVSGPSRDGIPTRSGDSFGESPRDAGLARPRQHSQHPSPEIGAGPGARYLRARLAEHQKEEILRARASALAGDLDKVLLQHALECRSAMMPTQRLALRAAYLLPPSQIEAFRQAFETLRQEHPALRFLLSGPWPPYSFVTPSGSPAPAASSEAQGARAYAPSEGMLSPAARMYDALERVL